MWTALVVRAALAGPAAHYDAGAVASASAVFAAVQAEMAPRFESAQGRAQVVGDALRQYDTALDLLGARAPESDRARYDELRKAFVDGDGVIEKSVFGILHETRQQWVELLCTVPTAPTEAEAQDFISHVLQPCINLMHVTTPWLLMRNALECVQARLQVYTPPSPSFSPTSHSPPPPLPPLPQGDNTSHQHVLVAPFRVDLQRFCADKFLPALTYMV